MNSRLLRLFIATGVVATLFGCGGNCLPHTNQVTATVTPAAATVAPGCSVTLTGNATGFTTGPVVDWYL
jgi:hypothetical protein